MESGHELFQHTADVGVRAWAGTLGDLLQPAAAGLYEVIGKLHPGDVQEAVKLRFTGEETEVILRDFLAELLFEYAAHRRILAGMKGEVFSDKELSGRFVFAVVDDGKSEVHQEVKAVTYHELSVVKEEREGKSAYVATYIVDL